MNEIIIIVGLIIIFILIVLLLLQNSKTNQTLRQKDEMISQITTTLKSQNDTILLLNQQNLKSLGNDERFDERLKSMNDSVQYLLKTAAISFKQVNEIEDKIKDINNIMINKKARGNWGEYQLNNLLSIYAGDNQNIYQIQYSLKNGVIGDVALHLPGNEKVLIIDSKFPLENYQYLLNDDLLEVERNRYESLFKQSIKKHINDIAKKYITNETVDYAVMFIPSEAIYMLICASFSDLIEYGHRKHVLITCPTTLIGVVFTLINITKDFNRNKHIKTLEKDIVSMYEDVLRLNDRIDNVELSINRLLKTFNDVKTSSKKISNRIIKIHDGYDGEK